MSVVVICNCGQRFEAGDDQGLASCPGCGRDQLVPSPRFFDGLSFQRPLREKPSALAITSLALGMLSLVLGVTVVLAPLAGIPAILCGRRALLEIRESQGHLTGRRHAVFGIVLGALFSSLLPLGIILAVLTNGGQREASRRSQCVNNLKQIGIAMQNYHQAENRFPPPAITSPDGKPLLSWRVALLPYLEMGDLYQKFKLDEPWDSPHNKALLAKIPKVYHCPSDAGRASNPTATRYQVFVGAEALFEHGKAFAVSDVQDGTSNTLMVAEARDAVPWTSPNDLPFDPNAALPPLGSNHGNGVNALFADGFVRFLKLSDSWAVLRSLITRSGGEVFTDE